ncbi:MAG: hypothetical protein FWG97_00435 [Deltaproteobacteria bacterium]|nr:hypothetical protein [Deltaproteobacteria bacterium]
MRTVKTRAAIFILAALGLSIAVFLYLQGRQAQPRPPAPSSPALHDSGPPAPADSPGQRTLTFTDSEQNPISPQEAFGRILAAAEAGEATAMLNLAEFYGNGWGVRQNFTERLRWQQNAGEAGDPRGFFRAAHSLEAGLGAEADQAAARAALEKAAKAGLAEAHLKLGQDLLAGPEADASRAAAHLEEALKGGLPLAANMLALLYLQGGGDVGADAVKARAALEQGAELGDPEALKNLAVMNRQGWGGPQNPAEALKLYLAAQAAGWTGDGEIISALKAELGPRGAQEAEAEARAWLESRKPISQ